MVDSTLINSLTITNPLKKYVKILNQEMICERITYTIGLNVALSPFGAVVKPDLSKSAGFPFTDLDNFAIFLDRGSLIADIEVPPGIEIYADLSGNKWKAKQIIISNVRPVSSLPQWNDNKFCLAAVQKNGFALVYVKDDLKTNNILLAAVRQNGHVLEHIEDDLKTADVLLEAVRNNGLALRYVNFKIIDASTAFKVCMEAVKTHGVALQYVPDEFKTGEVILTAIQNDGFALQYVPVRLFTEAICLAAVRQNGIVLRYMRDCDQTRDICLVAVRKHGLALRYVSRELLTTEICLAAIRKSCWALQWIDDDLITEEMCIIAIQNDDSTRDSSILKYVPKRYGGNKV
jgi:hypothetical protein